MIPLTGRLLPGLDEFMLRGGHVKVLCNLACEGAGSWYRLNKYLLEQLAGHVPVAFATPEMAQYVLLKKLSPIAGEPAEKGLDDFRYPDMLLSIEQGVPSLSSRVNPISFQFQDVMLADSAVPSRVGALSLEKSRGGSKTGSSHIEDWSRMLELLAPSAEPFSEARLFVKLGGQTNGEKWVTNPYVPGLEMIVFANQLLSLDFDVFARLLPVLAKQNGVIRKKEAIGFIQECFAAIDVELDTSRHLTHGQSYGLERKLVEARGGGKVWTRSTAWHRASSRFESYVELGLLRKTSIKESFEYAYTPTDRASLVAETLAAASTMEDWLANHLLDATGAYPVSKSVELKETELLQMLPPVLAALGRLTAKVPIWVVALGLSWVKATQGERLNPGDARLALEGLAIKNPDTARLSRGPTGERAEFISFIPGPRLQGGK